MISLEEAKLHLRVDSSAEDALITLYIGAARTLIEQHIQRKLVILDRFSTLAENEVEIDDAIKAAALLLIGNLYENREATTEKLNELPLGYWSLIQPYRLMSV